MKAEPAPQIPFKNYPGLFTRAWHWLQSKNQARSGSKRLQVAETVSLGEKRFVAVIHVDGQRFLVGGSSGSVVLLTQLEANEAFDKVLKKTRAKRTPAVKQKGTEA